MVRYLKQDSDDGRPIKPAAQRKKLKLPKPPVKSFIRYRKPISTICILLLFGCGLFLIFRPSVYQAEAMFSIKNQDSVRIKKVLTELNNPRLAAQILGKTQASPGEHQTTITAEIEPLKEAVILRVSSKNAKKSVKVLKQLAHIFMLKSNTAYKVTHFGGLIGKTQKELKKINNEIKTAFLQKENLEEGAYLSNLSSQEKNTLTTAMRTQKASLKEKHDAALTKQKKIEKHIMTQHTDNPFYQFFLSESTHNRKLLETRRALNLLEIKTIILDTQFDNNTTPSIITHNEQVRNQKRGLTNILRQSYTKPLSLDDESVLTLIVQQELLTSTVTVLDAVFNRAYLEPKPFNQTAYSNIINQLQKLNEDKETLMAKIKQLKEMLESDTLNYDATITR